LVIPKVLTVNSAHDATDLVAKLRSFHVKAQSNKELHHLKWSVHFSEFVEK
jgi:T-complex protein 1 subunit alpha